MSAIHTGYEKTVHTCQKPILLEQPVLFHYANDLLKFCSGGPWPTESSISYRH